MPYCAEDDPTVISPSSGCEKTSCRGNQIGQHSDVPVLLASCTLFQAEKTQRRGDLDPCSLSDVDPMVFSLGMELGNKADELMNDGTSTSDDVVSFLKSDPGQDATPEAVDEELASPIVAGAGCLLDTYAVMDLGWIITLGTAHGGA